MRSAECSKVYDHVDEQYLSLLQDILDNGVYKEDRTGTGTLSVFSRTMRFDISRGKIPLLTTKKVFTKGLIHELIWFLSGDTNIRYLKEHNVNIWDSWVKKGTEEYEDLSYEEMYESLCKHFDVSYFVWNVREFSNHNDPELEFRTHTEMDRDDEASLVTTGEVLVRDNYTETMEAAVHHLCTSFNLPTKRLVAGELGPVYGKQWRAWEDVRFTDAEPSVQSTMFADGYVFKGSLLTPEDLAEGKCNGSQYVWKREIDQIAEIIRQLKKDPDSRRIVLNAWNVTQLKDMALPPCHLMLQLYTEPMSEAELKNQLKENDIGFSPMELVGVEPGTKCGYDFWRCANERFGLPTRHLSAELRLRSNDIALGNPFNIAQYAILVHMLAQVVNMNTKEFICSMGDAHLYSNQIDGAKEQLSRTPLWKVRPKVVLDKSITDINDFKYEHIQIVDYVSHERISFPGAAI